MNIQNIKTPARHPKSPHFKGSEAFAHAGSAFSLAPTIEYMKSLQRSDGYWWFSLEANETIGAEFIFLMNYLGEVDHEIQKGIAQRILDVQRPDGTWSLYKDGPADISAAVECYLALKIAGYKPDHPSLVRAREHILKNGGVEKARVFTWIHLAMFGLVPWSACPAMPAEFMLLPSWFYMSIYEFSSWARATVVPLLIFMSQKKVQKLPATARIDELFVSPVDKCDFSFKTKKGLISQEYGFIVLDKILKFCEKFPFKPLRKVSISKCADWTWKHVEKTEDIYPALAYCALAFKSLGYSNDSPQIKKPLEALKMFQQTYTTLDVPALPPEIHDDGKIPPSQIRSKAVIPAKAGIQSVLSETGSPIQALGDDNQSTTSNDRRIHQQCCISPVWDTPWMILSLLEAGVPNNDPALLKAGRWLLSKQIKEAKGDWAFKNRHTKPGGWSFEFENDYFPDVDDTVEVLTVLRRLAIPDEEKREAMKLGIDWILSMQNDDGGWGAFDINQKRELVNRIPFSDHAACLDPSSPDITGRMVEFLASEGFSKEDSAIKKALSYIWRTQENFGGWFARWGINYIYGTWCVLTALRAIGWNLDDPLIKRAVTWLEFNQHEDGGFGESPASYDQKEYVPLGRSVPSQTAWALMGLMAGQKTLSDSAKRAADYLYSTRNENSSWDELDYTGTGFPGHFYIRYHGYRHFFPLLALGKYQKK